MRLAIVNLTGGGFSGGYRKYLLNMLPRLAEHQDIESLLCVSPEGTDIRKWFTNPPGIDFCSCSRLALNHLLFIPDQKMAAGLRRFAPDIVFLPVERYIRFHGVPVVNMVQNMEMFVPNMKGDTLRNVFKKFLQRTLATNSIRRADHTIGVSGFVKSHLTANLLIPEHKVSQVYHGLTPPLTGIGQRPVSIPVGWSGCFLFTCGSICPARGIPDALDALADLRSKNLDVRLVIAGETAPSMRAYRGSLERLLVLRNLTDRVCWTGKLCDPEMAWCYKNCAAFLMTSRVESFGIIALEAMSYGCSCVSANNPCLPEIFRDTALYYEPGDGMDLSTQISAVFSWHDFKKEQTSQRAVTRASQFSWDVAADTTVSVLAEALNRSKREKGCLS